MQRKMSQESQASATTGPTLCQRLRKWLTPSICNTGTSESACWRLFQPGVQLAEPAQLKLSTDDSRTIEVKVTYAVNSQTKKQHYETELFLFFRPALEAIHVNMYNNMWQVVRLHVPKVSLLDLSTSHGLCGSSEALSSLVQEMLRKMRRSELTAEDVAGVLHRLRRHACVFRQALRADLKALLKVLWSCLAQPGLQGPSAEAHAERVVGFVQTMCQAVENIQQDCHLCWQPDMAPIVRDVWALVDEFLLVEAERALMKLLFEMDKMHGRLGAPYGSDSSPAPCQLQEGACGRAGSMAGEHGDRKSVMYPPTGGFGQNVSSYPPSAQQAEILVPARPAHTTGNPAVAEAVSAASLHSARFVISDSILKLQNTRRERGYQDSIKSIHDPHRNERYTNRVKVLKHNARTSLTLSHKAGSRSLLLADTVGTLVAGAAMCLAVASFYIAEQLGNDNRYSAAYVIIVVLGYMAKDRMKEWGKRYLEPIASKFGVDFPDRIVKVVDHNDKVVGECREECRVVSDSAIDEKVLSLRHKHRGCIPALGSASRPERVMVYRKKMVMHWENLDSAFRGVDGLDDVMRLDLSHFCRRMQPPLEPHYWLWQDGGDVGAERLLCARVYHINLVLRVRSHTSLAAEGDHQLMQFQRARVIMDRNGIVRLERRESLMVAKELSRPPSLIKPRLPGLLRLRRRPKQAAGVDPGLGSSPLWQPAQSAVF